MWGIPLVHLPAAQLVAAIRHGKSGELFGVHTSENPSTALVVSKSVCSQDERESPLQSSPASKEEKSSMIHHSLYTEMDHT
jgi:hypothetical protein